jgi:hypothetical protein
MNFVNKELCQELYAVSGWIPDHVYDASEDDTIWSDGQYVCIGDYRDKDYVIDIPNNPAQVAAYDLGYLLRKLPKRISVGEHRAALEFCTISDTDDSPWYMQYVGAGSPKYYQWADTPEDAAAKLCIELIKQKVILI